MSDSDIFDQVRDHVARITINRPRPDYPFPGRSGAAAPDRPAGATREP